MFSPSLINRINRLSGNLIKAIGVAGVSVDFAVTVSLHDNGKVPAEFQNIRVTEISDNRFQEFGGFALATTGAARLHKGVMHCAEFRGGKSHSLVSLIGLLQVSSINKHCLADGLSREPRPPKNNKDDSSQKKRREFENHVPEKVTHLVSTPYVGVWCFKEFEYGFVSGCCDQKKHAILGK
jgi:hypothetical protein